MFKRSRASKLLRQLQMKQLDEPEPAPQQDYLSERDCHRTYSCIHCRAHLANHDELISKLFQGNHGRAYLFNKVVNVGCKQAVERELLTGLHAVADIYCDCCETTLGWKYEQAFVPSQKYKEGKYIIELVHMLKENSWDLTSYNSKELLDLQQADELAEQLAGASFSPAGSRYRPRVKHTETSELNSRYLTSALATDHRQHNLAVPASRTHFSNSNSYTTFRRPQLESKFNLNSSGASANSDCSSGSGSRENLAQSASIEDRTTERQEQQESRHKISAVRRLVEAANVQDDANKTTTTRETIEIDNSQQESVGEGNNSSAISVQQ